MRTELVINSEDLDSFLSLTTVVGSINTNAVVQSPYLRISAPVKLRLNQCGIYVAEAGDTLTSIAAKFRTTTGALLNVEQTVTSAAALVRGSKINIPCRPKAAIIARQRRSYAIRSRDTFSSIAVKESVTTAALQRANPRANPRADPSNLTPDKGLDVPC